MIDFRETLIVSDGLFQQNILKEATRIINKLIRYIIGGNIFSNKRLASSRADVGLH